MLAYLLGTYAPVKYAFITYFVTEIYFYCKYNLQIFHLGSGFLIIRRPYHMMKQYYIYFG